MARKIRQLIVDLQSAGFQLVPGGKGSHRKFRHPCFHGSVILSGKDGDDALPYQAYIGYCPDLFPWGGVCHGVDEERTYRELRDLVTQEIKQLIADGKDLPPPITRPMREPAGV